MATRKLDDKSIAAARAPEGQRLEIWDETARGLCLRISCARGQQRRVWMWRYRTLDGRQPRLRLGEYSDQKGLRWARLEVGKLRAQVEEGADPAGSRRQKRADAKAETLRTFNHLADAYLTACETGLWKPRKRQKGERTISDERKILARYVRPVIGEKALEAIDRAAVRSLLRGLVERKIGAQTNRTHAIIRQVFNYAIGEDRLTANPATGFAALAEETARVRVLRDPELVALWRALESPAGLTLPPPKGSEERSPLYLSRPMAIALQLAAILLQRRGEILGMRVSELSLDEGVWLIPAARMKGRQPHMVPLPPLAGDLIREAMKLAKADSPDGAQPDPVFPSPRDLTKPMRPDSMTHAMQAAVAAAGLAAATVHDLRRTGATVMASERLGVAPYVVSRVLAHASDTGGGALVTLQHYNLYQYAKEKRAALEAWAGLLRLLTAQAEAAR